MLLRFGLKNHTSFRDASELNFIATSQEDEPSWRIKAPHTAHGVLPVVGVWGANSAGKSNLLRALLALRHLVKFSFTKPGPKDPVRWFPFAMRQGDDALPTQMDLDLVVDGQRYHYGVCFRSQGVTEEWLFTWPKGRKQVLFHRDHGQTDPWYFGPSLSGQRQAIVKATRSNSLFLSAAAQYEHEQLSAIYQAISDGICSERRIELHGHPLFTGASPILDPKMRPAVLAFLGAADLGIVDMRAEALPVKTAEELAQVFQPDFLKEFSQSIKPPESMFKLVFMHGTSSDAGWELSPEMESRGTHILLRRLEDLILVLRSGAALVLDEIDTSLHPDLCGVLLDLFTSPVTNPRGAQLIFSTHHGELLARLRRDEVVLIDKARDGASTIHSASDYASVRGRDDLALAYAHGRIRGVPALGDLTGIVARGLHDAS